ncbi:tetratricopeptide repeat protein [Anthocerotibacter panamensis]|uniref:tetratricopeptide repeat protein n=1 Tax=Anthocerotibacter panamensis TaxID=2857077 RepID=UPI001C4075FD|nr:hypothetical protein [Anthocerotibacter panamensis]
MLLGSISFAPQSEVLEIAFGEHCYRVTAQGVTAAPLDAYFRLDLCTPIPIPYRLPLEAVQFREVLDGEAKVVRVVVQGDGRALTITTYWQQQQWIAFTLCHQSSSSEEVIELCQQSSQTYFDLERREQLAWDLRNNGHYQEAREEFRQVLYQTKDPLKGCALMLEIGNCEYLLGQSVEQSSKAYQWYQRAQRALALYGSEAQLSDFTGKYNPWKRLHMRILVNLANINVVRGRLEEGKAGYEAVIRYAQPLGLQREYHFALQGQALIASILGQRDRVIDVLEFCKKIDVATLRENYSLRLNLSHSYILVGRLIEADIELKKMLDDYEQEELRATVIYNLAWIAELRGEIGTALEYYQWSYSTHPNLDSLVGLAWLLRFQDPSEAISLVLQAVRLLEEVAFDPLQDYTLEWIKILDILRHRPQFYNALDSAGFWIARMSTCLPAAYWETPARRKFLQCIRDYENSLNLASSPKV